MEIRKSRPEDMDTLLALYEAGRAFMTENGNPDQWAEDYPGKAMLFADMDKGHGYVCMDHGAIVGTFYYAVEMEADYGIIYEGTWLNDTPYGVVHRITSKAGTKGVASFCLDWCLDDCRNLRIDTHRLNQPMRNMLVKNGYTECGIIYLANGDERIGYHKTLR